MTVKTLSLIDTLAPVLRHFIHRRDVHAQQRADGRWELVKQPLTEVLLRSHLCGEVTLGSYVIAPGDTVQYFAVDIDNQSSTPTGKRTADCRRLIGRLRESASRMGCPHIVVNASGRRGYHLTILFSRRIKAGRARALGLAILKGAGLPPNHVWQDLSCEVFPKQDQLKPSGYGNLISLPEGKHRRGGRSGFVDPDTLEMIPRTELPMWVPEGIQVNDVNAIVFPKTIVTEGALKTTAQASANRAEGLEQALRLLHLDARIRGLFFGDAVLLKQYRSRSEAELALLVRLGRRGVSLNMAAAFVATSSIGKWHGAGDSYREHTLAAAARFLREQHEQDGVEEARSIHQQQSGQPR